MKKKLPVLLSLVLLSFMVALGWGQVTVVHSSDFDVSQGAVFTTAGEIGTSGWFVSRSGDDLGARIDNNILELTNDVGGTANVFGWVYAYRNTGDFSSPYNTTLGSNTDLVTWYFNMRQIRPDPSGFGTNTYGVAFVIGSTSNDVRQNGSGYAVVLGNSTSVDPIRFVKFSNGIEDAGTSAATGLIIASAPLDDPNDSHMSLKLTYDPTTDTWELYGRNDGSSFQDPQSGTLTLLGSATDNDHTGISLDFMGGYWQAATAGSQTAFFDNVTVQVGDEGPSILHTALGNTSSTDDRTATATITGNALVTTGDDRPVLWYQVDGGGFTSTYFTSQTGDDFDFTIPGQSVGSTVHYYIGAADADGIATSPAGGSGTPPPGSTPPASFHTYQIEAPAITKTWSGGGDGSSWEDDSNWDPVGAPAAGDTVLLDNSTVAGSYTVDLPSIGTTTEVVSVTITPGSGNTITLNLPSGNTANPGLRMTGDGDALVLNDGAVFRNSSGATSGAGIELSASGATLRINDGGHYIHNTVRAHSTDIVAKLSTEAGTENGIFEFDVPGGGAYTISAAGRTYGTLLLNATAAGGTKPYSMTGGSPLTIQGSFSIDAGVSLTSSMTADMSVGGDFENNGTVALTGTQNVTIAGDMVLNGTITTDETIQLGTTSETNLTYTSGRIIGAFARFVETGSSLLFPIGTADFYRPVTIDFTSAPTTSGLLTVSHTDGNFFTLLTPSLNDAGYTVDRRSNMFWDIAPGAIDGGTFDLSVNGDGQEGINDPPELRIVRSADGGTSFALVGTHAAGSGTTANREGISGGDYGRFYLGANQADNPLPISLSSFTATAGNGKVTLRWITESEQENVGFKILRAADKSGTYQQIGSYENNDELKGQFNSASQTKYRFIDQTVVNDVTYWYKLVDVDANGVHTEHPPISATPHAAGNEVTTLSTTPPGSFALHPNFPNPFNPSTTLRFDIPALSTGNTDVEMVIFNIQGQKVKTLYKGSLTPGTHQLIWAGDTESGERVSSGTYYAILRMENLVKTTKLLLIK